MVKLQENNGVYTVVIPKHIARFMGWAKGNTVLMNADKENDSIIIVRDARHRSGKQ